jgi:16S rRNA G966 N2-methylase RsmD
MQRIPIDQIRVNPEGRRALNPEKVAELAGSIRELGLLQPIGVRRETLELVYGYHRLEACRQLGWESIPVVFVDGNDLQARLAELHENLIRNELTALERAEHLAECERIYTQLYPDAKRPFGGSEAAQLRWHAGETVSPAFTEYVSRETGLSQRAVQQDLQIAHHLVPEVKEQIRGTELADRKRELLVLARLEPERQKQVVARVLSGRADTVANALKQLQREESRTPRLYGQYAGVEIRRGDFREVLADIPDRSVDIILTDPPYPKEYLPLWDALGEFAARVLKPTGVLLAYTGKLHLPEVLQRLGKFLRYWWTLAIPRGGATNLIVHAGRRFQNRWRPVLVFVPHDSPGIDKVAPDMIQEAGRDKSLHNWQQPTDEAKRLLAIYGEPGMLVIDPFAGSGSFGRAAVELGMRFIGAEILGLEAEPIPCPDCNTQYRHKDGTTYGDGLCADCGGTGKDPLTDEPCDACFGSGLCDTCNGEGVLWSGTSSAR